MVDAADRVFTMGCSLAKACPAIRPQAEGGELEDPAGRPIEVVRQIRDEIEARVRRLVAEMSSTR